MRSILATTFALLVLAGVGPAQQAASVAGQSFRELDRNRDGKIDRSEWNADANSFRALDGNQDGVLDAREYFLRGNEFNRAQRFAAWDSNHDNVLEPSEWQSSTELFHQLDVNSDTRVDSDEFMAANIDVRFRDYDRNQDGRISRAEWTGLPEEFVALDLDRNGFLNPEEYFLRGGQASLADRFQRWDVNHDNMIEGNEWHAPEEVFHRLDTDSNSVLSRSEFLAAERTLSSGNASAPAGEQVHPGFEYLDRNQDGVISRDEWRGDDQSFNGYDRNGDGVISTDEIR